MRRPRAAAEVPSIELLVVDGCPNARAAHDLVTKVAAEVAPQARIRVVRVDDAEAALRLRFLGSPSVRVDGLDVDPAAVDRDGGDYAMTCRLYRTDAGVALTPDERWIRDALRRPAA